MLGWENLGKSYGRRRLFYALSGESVPGEGLLVVGHNGSGKSTLLKVLVGLVRPDLGSVIRPVERDEIGYAAPHLALYGELSGIENLKFYSKLRGVDVSEAPGRLLERLGLARAANKAVSTYSTGMVQRLRIGCALIHSPQILILDEPTIGLDRDGVALVEQVVAEHVGDGKAGRSAIIATNDPDHFAGVAQHWPSISMGS